MCVYWIVLLLHLSESGELERNDDFLFKLIHQTKYYLQRVRDMLRSRGLYMFSTCTTSIHNNCLSPTTTKKREGAYHIDTVFLSLFKKTWTTNIHS